MVHSSTRRTLALFTTLLGLIACDPASAQPPDELRIPSQSQNELDRQYPSVPTWIALDWHRDTKENPRSFGLERVEDFRKPLRGIERPKEGNCFVNDVSRIYDGPSHYSGTIEQHLAGPGGVAIVRVLSVTPGVAGIELASALEVELVEDVSVRDGVGPFPRYILYPAVSLEVEGEPFCLRDKGFPPLPEPGDELAISIRTRPHGPTRELQYAALLLYDNLILHLDAEGPKAPHDQWTKLSERERQLSKSEMRAWVRKAARESPK